MPRLPIPSAVIATLVLGLALPALGFHRRPRPRPLTTPPACTHYASPTGTGTTCTREAPCAVRTWTENPTLAQPGRALCLLPGHYTQGSGRIVVPDTVNGTEAARIWIRAEQPGSVLLDGGDSARPVDVRGDWIVIHGINACCGDNYNVALLSNDGYVKDVVAWHAGVGGDGGFRVTGCRNTFEDIAHFGTARYPISATQEACGGNVVRRAWLRWEGNGHETSDPTATAILGYQQDRLLFENLWLTWDYTSMRQSSPEGIASVWSSVDSQWLGSIAYLPASATAAVQRLFVGYVDGGSHSQQGDFHPMRNFLARHNLAVVAPSFPQFAQTRGFHFVECTDAGCPQGSNNVIEDSVAVSGGPGTFSVSWTPRNLQEGRSLAEAIGSGKNVWTESVASPGLCYRYVNGQPTTQPLWPIPMTTRIRAALEQAGYPALDVTQEIEQVVGQTIPPQCRTDSVPIPPEPEPEPPQPPTVGALTCSGNLLAEGKIALQCQPQEGRR